MVCELSILNLVVFYCLRLSFVFFRFIGRGSRECRCRGFYLGFGVANR